MIFPRVIVICQSKYGMHPIKVTKWNYIFAFIYFYFKDRERLPWLVDNLHATEIIINLVAKEFHY